MEKLTVIAFLAFAGLDELPAQGVLWVQVFAATFLTTTRANTILLELRTPFALLLDFALSLALATTSNLSIFTNKEPLATTLALGFGTLETIRRFVARLAAVVANYAGASSTLSTSSLTAIR